MMRWLKQVQPAEIPDVLLGAGLPEVLRVASELYAQDRAVIERAAQRQELQQAAAEAGLPPEYLERAAAVLQGQRLARRSRRRRRWGAALAAIGVAVTFWAGRGLARDPVLLPPTVTPTAYTRSYAQADLRGVDFHDTDLHGQDFSMANLRGAILRGANLHGANLHGANLIGADLRSADLAGATLDNVVYDRTTRWPAQFRPPVLRMLRRD
jgi:uncharacterized protein YjbI with pentapeptide repeats